MVNRKVGALLAPFVFLGVALALTHARAEVGDSPAQLIARYGAPEDTSALSLGVGDWKTPHAEISAILENNKAIIMSYRGVDEKTKDTFLKQNLPRGQTWVDGKDFRAFAQGRQGVGADPQEQLWQTTDGKVWAAYNLERKILLVATPEGVKRFSFSQ
jgi:hypothetical protein